jgi:ribulose-phosphate 3-epimerase
MSDSLRLSLGVKTDPIEYRYSYEWLFRLMSGEGVRHLQLGTFFEMYQLPDAYFIELRKQASDHGIEITSVFTAHRELGGFFRSETGWVDVARRNYERMIEVGALLGARSVGSNPGAILRDRMESKDASTMTYLHHMKELMVIAKERGLDALTMEPMSCLAEPPTLPEEIVMMAEELAAFHGAHPNTVPVGYCADASHGYVNQGGAVVYDNLHLLKVALPYLYEVHLKNTDALFNTTFGFSDKEFSRGIVDVPAVRALLRGNAGLIPVQEIVGYLEIGGPKIGRDYTDPLLEVSLRESLQYLQKTFAD